MELNVVLKEKREKNILIKKNFWLLQKYKALGLIKITNKSLIKDLRDGLVVLPACFVICMEWVETDKIWKNIVATSDISESDLIWFDFIIWDDELENLNKFLELWITPIVSETNPLHSILKEFNPVKNEWNSYIYQTLDKWSIFYSLVKYLENYKFSFDNKNLVKNVLAI